jgi:glutamine synthetase
MLKKFRQRQADTAKKPPENNLADNPDLHYIRTTWCDNAGLIRAKASHKDHFINNISKHGLPLSQAIQGAPVAQDTTVPTSGLAPVGEIQLLPDMTTFVPLTYTPGHARVIGDMFYQDEPWAYCPRYFLKRMLAKAKQHHLSFEAAFENEFCLLNKSGDDFSLTDQSPFCASSALDIHHAFFAELTDALIQQNIQPLNYHAESGQSQHELSIMHTDPLAACDQQIMMRDTVKAVAANAGLLGTFVPKLFEHSAANGSHLHLSLKHRGQPLFFQHDERYGLKTLLRQFVAGIYHHLPALMTLTTSTPNSFRRFVPHTWSGAYQIVGFQNREAAIRLIDDPQNPNVEIKAVDGTCNPYLAMGAIIAAGLDGIEKTLELPELIDFDPCNLNKRALKTLGIRRLPENSLVAMTALKNDEPLCEALGTKLCQAILSVREYDWHYFKNKTLEKEVVELMRRY